LIFSPGYKAFSALNPFSLLNYEIEFSLILVAALFTLRRAPPNRSAQRISGD